ncbi:hypothetical protein FUAX_50020 (plasmid) [Fulvitalea axinellae]|uniref:Glucose/arabinose dehydrogenase, beta-propeller fold n=1 Tax=Fulvitalea axinellae TaxID=1182444 RepID=A0AAU9DJ15_9BACT|nr:hypothetical protein FUAX_50020 [Fulvitalea axinellae]
MRFFAPIFFPMLLLCSCSLAQNPVKKLYADNCAGCHGEKLETFSNRKWINGKTVEAIEKSIRKGIPDLGMVPFDTAFSDTEITKLAKFIAKSSEKAKPRTFDESGDWISPVHSDKLSFRIVPVVTEGVVSPWGMDFLPNGDMLITDKAGKLFRMDTSERLTEISGAPEVLYARQGGMLDVIVDPDFGKNKRIYLSFSKGKEDKATTAVVSAKLSGDRLTEVKEIFEAKPYLSTRHHYGSRLAFGADGLLYITVGDRGRRDDNPQSLKNDCGKVHRIYPDGSIPKDNPFLGQKGARESIFSYGHRNPQGLAFHPVTGQLWAHEHGPKGGDELNPIRKGENYGWPVVSYGVNYSGTRFTKLTEKPGMTSPTHYWVPSIAPCGMSFVSGDKYPGWNGNILVGSLSFKYIARLELTDGKVTAEEPLLKKIGRVRDISQGPDGTLYFSVEKPGRIFKILPLVEN